MPHRETHVVLAVIAENHDRVAKTMETFTTIAAGLAMDGIETRIETHILECDCEEETIDD